MADRILHTLANSVPCERNFSALNLLHTKGRNQLIPERVHKLLYVQINRRTLRREASYKILEEEGGEEEEEDDTMEDAGEDATLEGPAHITEAQQRENAAIEVSEDGLV